LAEAGMPGPSGGMGGPALLGDPAGAANRGSGPRIYVGGIPTAVSETMVRNHFTQWGQVRAASYPFHSRSRGITCIARGGSVSCLLLQPALI
jgi:hypothetical protein